MTKPKNDPLTRILGDSLRRDDMREPSKAEAFDTLENPEIQRSLIRAATHGRARLPLEMGQGWIMVPTKCGTVHVAYDGRTAFRL